MSRALAAAAVAAAVFATAASSRPVAFSYASPSWSPNGRELAFGRARGPDGAVLVARADGKNVTRIARARFLSRVVWSPDGTRIAYVSGGRVFVLDRNGRGGRSVGPGASVVWSPDSTQIAFDSGWKGPIRVANADGSAARPVTDGRYDRAPSWAPDGRRIVFSRAAGPGTAETLFVVGTDGEGLRSLGIRGGDASWSPDGRRLAYWLRTPDGVALAVVDLGGDGLVITRSLPAYSGSPTWSPDGTKIAFTPCGEFGACRVDVADPEGREVTILGSGAEPTWAPDGSRVAFAARRACRTSSIFTVEPDGERLARVTRCRR